MKKIIIFFSIFVNFLIFADIRDGEKIFSDEEIKDINKELVKVENSKKVRIILNTLPYGEGFVVDSPVRTIIINIGKSEDGNNLRVENSFSRDLAMDEKEEELNEVSDMLAAYIEKGEVANYSINYIRALNRILEEKNQEKTNEMFSLLYENRWFLIKIAVLILTIFNILVRIKHISIEKQKRYEKKLEKEKMRREEMKILMEKRKNNKE